MSTIQIDESKIERFVEQVVMEAGAALSAALAYVGDRLGLYRVMAEGGPMTSADLAERTGTHERMVREWLANQAAGGLVVYEPQAGTFELPIEHAVALAQDDTPAAVAGLYQFIVAAYRDVDSLVDAFQTGAGLGWRDHHPELFAAVERVTRPEYETYLVDEWIPTLGGVEEMLRNGGKVADVGCGYGTATMIMAKAFPDSEFVGFDSHEASIERARKLAAQDGLSDRVRFEVAAGTSFGGDGYDLICFLDALHDMGDPLGVVRHARTTLAREGSVLLVELLAGDHLEDNLTPVGRLAYAISTIVCTPSALAQGGAALGAQAGKARMHALFSEAGFSRFEQVAETPFSLVLQARH